MTYIPIEKGTKPFIIYSQIGIILGICFISTQKFNNFCCLVSNSPISFIVV